eukprot:5304342-Pleurochrysis_carterae.AAC.1
MASKNNTDTPDAGQRELAGPNLSALVGELALLLHAAAIGENYDADRISALATALQRETARERVRSSAPAATSTDVLPIFAVRATAVASSTPATATASVANSTFVPAAASAAVASSPTFHATSLGDGRTSWPPEPIH